MTMVIDTSAYMSVLLAEEDAHFFREKIADSDGPLMSAATRLELFRVVKGRFGAAELGRIGMLDAIAMPRIEPFTKDQLEWAKYASEHFNKLNMGDCYSYALAKDKGLPLLFKGDDFCQTDLTLLCPTADSKSVGTTDAGNIRAN